MRTFACFSFLVLVLSSLFGLPQAEAISLGDEKVSMSSEPFHLTADTVTYKRETGIYTAKGNVEITQTNRLLKADYIEFDYRNQLAQAQGNVQYTEDADTLKCGFLILNMETREGIVKDGDLFYSKENFYLNGKHIEKRGENRYRITDGEFTTCDGKKPAWKFVCKEVDVTLEGLAKVKGATFKIKDVPVFYFPYFLYPAKLKRQSGLLLPNVGNSSTEGASINNAYYWAISPSSDATAYLDLATKKGVGYGGEYRYIRSETDYGRFYGYFTEERDKYRDEEYSALLDRSKERWNVFYEGKKDFNDDFFARVKADLVSDRQYYKDYGDRYGNSSTVRSSERTETTAFLTKHWPGFSMVGDVEYNYDLLEDNDPTLQRYPQLLFTAVPRAIGPTPLYATMAGSYSNFAREEGQEGDRIDFDPSLLLPLRLGKNFLLQSRAGFRQTNYFATSDDEGLDDNRGLFHFNSELSTKFMRVFGRKGSLRPRYRHTVEPALIYTYVPDEGQEDLPLYDQADRLREQNRITLALTNRFMGKYFRPDATSWERELLFLRIGQYYDATTSNNPFSDFFLELRTRPHPYWYVKTKADYDVYEEELEAFSTLLYFQDRRKDYASVEYRFTNQGPFYIDPFSDLEFIGDEIEEIDTRLGLALTQQFGLFFENRHTTSRTLETLFGFDFHPQCWGAAFKYRIRPGTEGRDRENRFWLEFYLKGIGKVGQIGG